MQLPACQRQVMKQPAATLLDTPMLLGYSASHEKAYPFLAYRQLARFQPSIYSLFFTRVFIQSKSHPHTPATYANSQPD
jgi:hypothetical protein